MATKRQATRSQSTAPSTTTSSNSRTLRFDDGAVQFRQRIAVSLLSCRPLLIRNIRSDDVEAPGLRTYEASFLRLIDAMTNGSRIEINNTGTQLRFVPGVLIGGDIKHECPAGERSNNNNNSSGDAGTTQQSSNNYRSIGWFLEGILPLAPFGKEPLSLTLHGITDGTCHMDPSPDYLRASALPLMQRFGIGVIDPDDQLFVAGNLSLKVVTRGAAPAGGGRVDFFCPMIPKELQPIDWTDPGLIKRVRGTCVSCKIVSSSLAARVAFAAKGVLHRLLPDVWIHTNVNTVKQHHCGPSPGLSLVITAESTTGVFMTAECCLEQQQQPSNSRGSLPTRELPDDMGQRGAAMLLEEIRRGGCVDTGMQSLALLWMCLTPEDVSRIRVGTLSSYTIESLRLFKTAFGVEFKVKADHDTKTVLLSCLGTGYRNMARASS